MAKTLQYQSLVEPLAPSAPIVVQVVTATGTGVTSLTANLPGVGVGNALVVGVSVQAHALVESPSDDQGDTYGSVVNFERAGTPSPARSDIWAAFNVKGGTTNVKVTFSVSVSEAEIIVCEVNNLDGNFFFSDANPNLVVDEGATTGTAHISSAVPAVGSPSGSFTLCVGSCSASVAGAAAGAGYTLRTAGTSAVFQYRTDGAAMPSNSGPFTTGFSSSNLGVMATFRSGASSPTINPYSAAMQPQTPDSYQFPASRFRQSDAYFAPLTVAAPVGPTVAQIMAALQPQLDTQWQKRYPPLFADARPVMPTPWWRWQSAGVNSSAGVASQALSLLNPTVSGRAIIVGVASFNSGSATIAVTDDKGNAYAQIGGYQTAGAGRISIFACFNIIGSAAPVITATPSSSCFITMQAGEYSGLAQTGQPDGTNGATGTSTAPDTGSIAVNSANELMLSFVSQVTNNSSSLAANSGQAGLYLNNTAPMPLGVAEANVSTAGDGTFTFGSSVAWLTVGASFKLTPAGGGPSVAQIMAALQPQWIPVPQKPRFIGSDGSVAPIAPSLYPVNLGWLIQQPDPIAYKKPMGETLYVEPLRPIPPIVVPSMSTWYVEQPVAPPKPIPAQVGYFVNPVVWPIPPNVVLLGETAAYNVTVVQSSAFNVTIIVSSAFNPDT